jgi:hypothetical protein
MINIYIYCKDNFVVESFVDFFEKQQLENIKFKALNKKDDFKITDILIVDDNLIDKLWFKPALLIQLSFNNATIDTNSNIINMPFQLKDLKRMIDILAIQSKSMVCFNDLAFLYDTEEGSLFSTKKEIENQKFRAKEAFLLKFFLEAYPKETERSVLLKNVWGFEDNINTHTLETHVATLRKKLATFGIKILKNDIGCYRLDFIEVG